MADVVGEAARQLEAAAALLLRAPDRRLLTALSRWHGGGPLSVDEVRQDFYDTLCLPQSARFVPPYEHVVRAGRREGRLWHFPPARFDGGDKVAEVYRSFGFEPRGLDVEPLLRAPHLPADHIGFMFAFLAAAWPRGRGEDEAGRRLSLFVSEHLGPWVDRYADLVSARGGPYLAAVGTAAREAAALVRHRLTPASIPPPDREVVRRHAGA